MQHKVYDVVSVNHNGSIYVGFWSRYLTSSGEESHDSFLNIYKIPEMKSIDEFTHDFEMGELKDYRELHTQALLDSIHQEGVLRLQDELGIVEPTYDPEIAYKVIEKAWNHEYIGQYKNSYAFYMQNLAECLKIRERECYEVFAQLEESGRAGLNGAIIVPYSVQEASFIHLEATTGHKRLDMGDFGTWRCFHCGQFGDERMSPLDYPCK